MMPMRLMAWPIALVVESRLVVATCRTKKGPFNFPLPLVSKVCAAAGIASAAQKALRNVRILIDLVIAMAIVALMVPRGGIVGRLRYASRVAGCPAVFRVRSIVVGTRQGIRLPDGPGCALQSARDM